MEPKRREELLRLNDLYCLRNDIWHLHPYNGRCYSCGYDLVEHYGDGYETAVLSGCPKCNRSYCD